MLDKKEFLAAAQSIVFDQDTSIPKTKPRIRSSNRKSWSITQFPNKPMLAKHLEHIEGMSTAANCYLINSICRSMTEQETFLNIGVWKGLTLSAGLADTQCRVIGVDNFSQFKGPRESFNNNYSNLSRANSSFWDMDYQDYFNSQHQGTVEFYLYDGHHSYDNQYQAIKIAAPWLANRSIIMVDDTNEHGPRQGTFDALDHLGLDYDVWFDQTTAANMSPTYWNGIAVIEIRKQ